MWMPGVILLHWLAKFSNGGKRVVSRVISFFLYHYRMEIKPLTYLYLADILWREIDQLNQSFAQILLHITKLHNDDPDNYGAAVKYLSSLQPIQVRKCSASSFDRSHHLTWDALFSLVGG